MLTVVIIVSWKPNPVRYTYLIPTRTKKEIYFWHSVSVILSSTSRSRGSKDPGIHNPSAKHEVSRQLHVPVPITLLEWMEPTAGVEAIANKTKNSCHLAGNLTLAVQHGNARSTGYSSSVHEFSQAWIFFVTFQHVNPFSASISYLTKAQVHSEELEVHDSSRTLAEANVVVTWLTTMLCTAKSQLRNSARRLVILTDDCTKSSQENSGTWPQNTCMSISPSIR